MNVRQLGQTIAQLRKSQKLSQTQLSEDLGLSRATVNILEKGAVNDVGIKKVLKVLGYLGYTLEIKPQNLLPTLDDLQDE